MKYKVSNVCQLLDKSRFSATSVFNGVTFTNNGDGSYTVNGTSTATTDTYFNFYNIGKDLRGSVVKGNISKGYYAVDVTYDHRNGYLFYMILIGQTFNNLKIYPQLFDLTEMYGAGHEPTTVAQFRQDFPNEMYEYSPVCWKNIRRLKYVTETKNLFKFSDTIGTLTDFSSTTVRNFEEDKWYVGLSSNNYYFPNTISSYSIKDNLITINTGASGYGLGRAFKTDANVTYYFTTTGYFAVGFYNNSGEKISTTYPYRNKGAFTTPDNCAWFTIVLRPDPTNTDCIYQNSQLELGSTSSPYQPYGYLPLNRGKYIANKEPVQLLDKSKYPATGSLNGVTWTNNGNGTITATGQVITLGSWFIIDDAAVTLISTHKYLLCGCPSGGTISTYWLRFLPFITGDPKDTGSGIIFIAQETVTCHPVLQINRNRGDNLVWKPQLFDLTEMYGAGHEPTTVAQFRADYPNELYDYNPYNVISFH